MSCPDIGCVSPFRGGYITFNGFNFQQLDSIKYIKYPRNNFQTPLDSFSVMVDLSQSSRNTANNVIVEPGSSFNTANDWIIFMPSGERYTLTDIRMFEKECAKCTKGYTYYDEYEVRVNGQLQIGSVVITK